MPKNDTDSAKDVLPIYSSIPVSPPAKALLKQYQWEHRDRILEQAHLLARGNDTVTSNDIQQAKLMLNQPRQIRRLRQGSILLAGAFAGNVVPAIGSIVQQWVSTGGTGSVSLESITSLIFTLGATAVLTWYGFGKDVN